MAGYFSASVVVGLDLAVCGGSCLACQRRLRVGENCWGMVTRSRASEYPWWGLFLGLNLACNVAALVLPMFTGEVELALLPAVRCNAVSAFAPGR
jgi:hypothetical protein